MTRTRPSLRGLYVDRAPTSRLRADASPPTPMLVVRPATLDDLETILALRLDLLGEAHDHPVYGRLRPDAARRARRLFRSQLESTWEVTLLAERAGDAVGILRCVDSEGSPLLEPDRFAYVSSVYVVPLARRGGVLRALLARATAWCDLRGLDEMRLHSAAGAAANAAWDALGFQLVEHLRIRTIGPAVPSPSRSARVRERVVRRLDDR